MYVQNIFLADDDHEDIQFFQDAVKDISDTISITYATNGRELINLLENYEPNVNEDLIFLDLNMPLMNGFDCLRMLKAHPVLKDIPVVILSTGNDPHNMKILYDMGAHHYIVKPYSYAALREVLLRVLSIDFRHSYQCSEFIEFLLQ